MTNSITKDQWIAMFKELGLNEKQMRQWHRIFETQHPAGHEQFLQWLGIPAKEIAQIRQASRPESA